MGITIDDSIRLLEDYHKWEKQFGLDGSGVDDATNKLIEVAKKYQKIQAIINNAKDSDGAVKYNWLYEQIGEVLEDGNDSI